MIDNTWIIDEDDFEFEHEKKIKKPTLSLPKWLQYKEKYNDKLEFGDVLKNATEDNTNKDLYLGKARE